MEFKDNFSNHAEIYRQYRPEYPEQLFEFINSLVSHHEYAWDAGTGNGQSAAALARYFKKVYATDPSESQLRFAPKLANIEYKIETAENCSLKESSVDLITVAQALHWFDLHKFYSEVNRVLKHDGVIAVWTYHLPRVSKEIDAIINDFHDKTLDDFWVHENRIVDNKYSTIQFPFLEIDAPEFSITKEITVDDLLGLVRSWSAVQRYIENRRLNPVDLIEGEIKDLWSQGSAEREATWKIILKAGKKLSK